MDISLQRHVILIPQQNLALDSDMLVQIYLWGVERGPMYEACHMVKTVDLYKNFYNKPIVEVVESSPRIQVCILTFFSNAEK